MPGKLKSKLIIGGLMIGLCLSSAVHAAPPPGPSTAPYFLSYSAKLTDSLGAPVTTAQSVRFSIWSDADSDATDYLPAGGINPLAGGYAGWQETHAVTPDANGLFHVRLGSITSLPNFTSSIYVFLEVDVKPAAAPDTSYDVLDRDGIIANLTDRFHLDASAYAINADTVSNKDVGSGPGNIPALDGAGILPVINMPGATNSETFILDFDDTVGGPAGSVVLQFGNTLSKFLEYDTAATWFNFNDDLNVTGNLTVTGTINGVVVNGTTVGPYSQSLAYEPEYDAVVIQPDGTGNKGKLELFYIDADGVPGNANYNYYLWTTTRPGLQDNDLVLRIKVPEGFSGFQATPIQFTYRTQDGVAANNFLDVSVEDTTGTAVALVGATSLVSAGWTTANITFGGAPTFTAGQSFTVKVKLSALNGGGAYASTLKINYTGR